MSLAEFIRKMPKVELHVHIEGSIRPETLLHLAKRNNMPLPADTVEGLREWYKFRDFAHFVEVYIAISRCIKSAEDVELIAREFLQGQADQNIIYTEATYTALTIEMQCGIPLQAQLDAINRAREWAENELGVRMQLIIDIVREAAVEDGQKVADFVIANHGNGVCALGLAGIEHRMQPSRHEEAFRRTRDAGVPAVCHAGETAGPWSIWGCLKDLHADRIGHGIQCLEDPLLVQELRSSQVHLEVCPTSNVCLGNASSLDDHPLPRMLNEGLNVSINSDDPPMFNTTLTDELIRCSEAFEFNEDILWSLTLNAARAAFLSENEQAILIAQLRERWAVGASR